MVIAVWVLALLGLLVWTLLAWGTHALLALDPSWVGDLKPLLDQVPFADVIGAWLPGWQEMLRATMDLTQTMLSWVGGAAPWIVGLVWAVGAFGLLILAVIGHVVVVVIRKGARHAGVAPARG